MSLPPIESILRGSAATAALLLCVSACASGDVAPRPAAAVGTPTAPAPAVPAPAAPVPDPCAAPVVCTTEDSAAQLRITRPGVYDGRGHRVPSILITAAGVTVRNFVVSGGTQTGIWSQGAGNTIADNDISNIGYGHDDIDAIRWFGDGTRILRNTIHDLVRGAIRDAHPDCAQTYANSLPGSSHVLIEGNRCLGLDYHQCFMAEGPRSTDGGGGGGGVSRDWRIEDNLCEGTSNQAIALRDIHDVAIVDNTFAGRNTKAIQRTDGTSGLTTGGNVLGPHVGRLIGD
ncbi:MAG TPA: right-handed parallel beta-helix repeat-containing protein [Pseudonocardia sp.]|nr:right-handed parallel beta-helix repeat-containing protein [Pseudonocardia sp.]